jgi:hypothetical protein
MSLEGLYMTHSDAAFSTVHDYQGGAVALASRIGMSAQILSNKVNPNCATNSLTLDDAHKIMALTGDFRMLHALAEELGFVCVSAEDAKAASDLDVVESLSKSMQEFGDVGKAVFDALADGKVELKEVKKVKHEVLEAFAAMSDLVQKLEGMSEK